MRPERHTAALHRLREYRIWGGAASALFLLFIGLGLVNVLKTTLALPLLFSALLAGFGWIGATSLSRHAFVNAKRSIGKEATVAEFLMTELAVPFFPLLYMKLGREVRSWLSASPEPATRRED
ncbi:MAG: hypothetical protein OHK006_01280 [Thermodesulfovibrionales bacterium]